MSSKCRFSFSLSATILTFASLAFGQIAVPSPGNISTVAGIGTQGYSGDGGFATSAQIGLVTDVAVDFAGNLYFADYSNNRIRKIDAKTGTVSTVAGNGTGAVFSRGNSWGDNGPASNAIVNAPWGIGLDKAGNLYITDPGNKVVRKVTAATGIITTVAGNPNWTGSGDQNLAVNAVLSQPYDVAVDDLGNIFIAEGKGNIIQEVFAETGLIKTIAGNGTFGYSGDRGLAIDAQLGTPTSIAVDAGGNIYFSDYDNNVVRKVTVSTGIITTVAGNGKPEYDGDGGLATKAGLKWPEFVNVDLSGNLYIADYSNCTVRKVNASTGVITTIAGKVALVDGRLTGVCGYEGDGAAAVGAEMFQNFGVAIDNYGNLYIADTKNFRIRLVSSGVAPGNAAYVSLSSSDPSPTMREVVSLKATVADAQAAPFTSGTVSFFSGNTSLGKSSVNGNGEATVLATLGNGGDQVITAQFANTISSSSGTLALHVSGFSISSSPASISLPKGQVANFTLNASAFYGFTGTVDLSCTGMPSPGSCSLSSNSVTLTNGISQSKVTLSVRTSAAATAKTNSALPGGLVLAGIFPLFLLGIRNQRYHRALWVALLEVSGALFSTGLVGCSGSGTKAVVPSETVTSVPAGAYTVKVIATSGSSSVQLPIAVTIN